MTGRRYILRERQICIMYLLESSLNLLMNVLEVFINKTKGTKYVTN